MYKYVADHQLGGDKSNIILRTADNAHIPNDLGNRDWVEYQVWLAVPNTPEASE